MSKFQYTKGQISFIMNLKKKGKTYEEIAKEFGKKYGIKKSLSSIESAFRRYKQNYDLDGLKSVVEVKAEVFKAEATQKLAQFVAKNQYIPSFIEFRTSNGYSMESIKKHFGSYENLQNTTRSEYPNAFSGVNDETNFTKENHEKLCNEISKYSRFVITTAVSGCSVHSGALKTIQSYCKRNNAKLLVLPISDPAHNLDRYYNFSLSSEIPQDSIVFKDTSLNKNLLISTIKMSAKQIKPLTGLKRLGLRGSCIFASPKQMLEHVSTSNKKAIPRAIMTTGAITRSDYSTDAYMSERTAYIADDDHQLGAIIVEIKDSQIFFYRRIEIDPKTGAFSDLNKKYFPNGKVENVRAEIVNQPDWHCLSTCPNFKKMSKEIVKIMNPKIMTFEDFFDGISINPHETHNILSKAHKTKNLLHSLEYELEQCANEINEVSTWNADQIVFKYGNHEDFLQRYLASAEYAKDPINHYIGVTLAKAHLEGHMPFEFAMRNIYNVNNQDKLKFLTINDSFIVNGIENGVHGHLGAGGKRNPTLEGLEIYGPVTVGHNHSAGILRKVVRMGTATKMQLSYNDGPGNWTNTLCIQHLDGARQLITMINGEYCLPDILK